MAPTGVRKRYTPRNPDPLLPVRESPNDPKRPSSAGSGVLRTRQTASKKARKLVRNAVYVNTRKKMALVRELEKSGEAEMVDVDKVQLSRRQAKLEERRRKALVHNARTKAEREKKPEMEVEKTEEEKTEEEKEVGMEIDS